MQDTSTIDIDLSAIDHNMAAVRRAVGDKGGDIESPDADDPHV